MPEDSIGIDEALVIDVNGRKRIRTQMCRITGRSVDESITIDPPAHYDMPLSLLLKAYSGTIQASLVGVEDLAISGAINTWAARMSQAYACWWYNVKINDSYNNHLFIRDSVNCEVRKCKFENTIATSIDPNAGVLLDGCSSCIVMDNIITKTHNHIQINSGSSGNVIAYNYLYDSKIGNYNRGSIFANYNGHNSFNLFEGNIGPSFQDSGMWGSSSESVLYRNWFHGTNPDITVSPYTFTINLNRFSRKYVIVNNVLGEQNVNNSNIWVGFPNYYNFTFYNLASASGGIWWSDYPNATGRAGYQELDQDVITSTTLYNNFKAEDPGIVLDTTSVFANSLFLSEKPTWFGSLEWPAIDPSNPRTAYTIIPAGYRYAYGVDP